MKKNNKSQVITFTNKPKFLEHQINYEINEKRIKLISLIEELISDHDRFVNKNISISFAHEGVSSLVSVIKIDSNKIVLKIPLDIKFQKSEVQFLDLWRKVGVKVPCVIEEGVLGEYSYAMMEYIDAITLEKKYKKGYVKKEIYSEMGNVLRLMHEPKAEGYGYSIKGKAEYAKFQDSIETEGVKKRVKYVCERNLLSDKHGLLIDAIETLIRHVSKEAKSSYCHNDFSMANIFATNPITIFDPSPKLNNRYLDLGLSIVLLIGRNGIFPREFVRSYFQGEIYDKKVLDASILFNSYMKFYYWNQVKKVLEIERVQRYLIINAAKSGLRELEI